MSETEGLLPNEAEKVKERYPNLYQKVMEMMNKPRDEQEQKAVKTYLESFIVKLYALDKQMNAPSIIYLMVRLIHNLRVVLDGIEFPHIPYQNDEMSFLKIIPEHKRYHTVVYHGKGLRFSGIEASLYYMIDCFGNVMATTTDSNFIFNNQFDVDFMREFIECINSAIEDFD